MPEAKSQIAFDQSGLGSILKQHQLAVPPNQREYAWTAREVTQLFHDFGKALPQIMENVIETAGPTVRCMFRRDLRLDLRHQHLALKHEIEHAAEKE